MKIRSKEKYVSELDKTLALFEADDGVPWICYKHPDGGWVTYKEPTQAEIWGFELLTEVSP